MQATAHRLSGETKANPLPAENQTICPVNPQPEIKNIDLLLRGFVFLKYGSWGDPGKRLISITSDYLLLEWRHVGDDRPSGFVSVKGLLGIKLGRTTSNFKRKPAKKPEQEKLSFTVVGDKRNLDLEAQSKEEMDQFLEGLVALIKFLKKNEPPKKQAPAVQTQPIRVF